MSFLTCVENSLSNLLSPKTLLADDRRKKARGYNLPRPYLLLEKFFRQR